MPMTDFHVSGPTKIRWGVGGTTGALDELGYTDNEDLIRISATDHKRMFSRNDQGDMVGEVVLSGTTFSIDFTMVSWDQDQLQKLINVVRTAANNGAVTAEGLFATVGGSVRTGPARRDLRLSIVPSRAGQISYTFDSLMLVSGPEYLDFGNTLKRIALSFQTMAPSSGNAVATTALTT
jgi:hypothetical protein